MGEALFIVSTLVVLSNSILILSIGAASYESLFDKYHVLKFCVVLTFFALLMIIPWQIGAIARYEVSALPWMVWQEESNRHGYSNGFLAVLINLIFILWVFLIPGHFAASKLFEKTEKRPVHPYAINILIGLILCTPMNSIYKFLGVFFGQL